MAVDTKVTVTPGMAPPKLHRDSMRTTWPFWDKQYWSVFHWIWHVLDVNPIHPTKKAPVFPKDAPVPHMPQWTMHLFILTFSWLPFALHQAYTHFFGPMHPVGVALMYTSLYMVVLVQEVRMIRKVGDKYGYLDGDKAPRDGVPDVGVSRVFMSIFKVVGGRVAVFTALLYNRAEAPLDAIVDPKWWAYTYFEIGIYSIVTDFWFYIYHRMMHDIDGLWRFHRTHHLTKHPNSTLAAYADDVQEIGDTLGIPLLAWATMELVGFHMGFYDWWMCQQFIVFTEVMGHSGLRLHLTASSTLHWVLDYLGLELALEDHDLHHRHGYRKSKNYGKQTRVWDTLFGTDGERIETYEQNVDYENQAYFPLF